MKYYLLVLISIISLSSFCQTSPPFINYQGIARNSSGLPITNATNPNISIKFEIYPSLTGGLNSFSEIQQNIPLSSLGLFTAKIGAVNNLNSVNWSTGNWYLEVFIDLNNGNNPIQSLGRQQLVSVPYALYADKAGSAPSPTLNFAGNVLTVGPYTTNINAGTTYSAGNGIDISNGIISNTLTASNTTVTGTNNVIVTNPSSNLYNVAVKAQTLTVVSGDTLKSTLGGSVFLPRTTITPSTNIGLTGNPINGYTITNIAPGSSSTSLVAGNTNLQLIPGINSYTLNSHSYSLSNSSNTLTLQNSPGSVSNTVVMPLTTISASNGIGVTGNPLSGYFINNIATPSISFASATVGTLNSGSGTSSTFTIPSPVLNGGTGIAIGGTWPNQTISAISTGSTAAWSTLGNTGTNPPSNFLGTTDNKEIVFKTNNNQHAVITTSGNVGIGVLSPAAKLDVSGSTPTALNVLNTSTGNAITANSNGGTPGIIVTNSGAGYALEAQNSSAGGSIHGFKGAGTAGGSAGVFINSSNINSSPVLNVINSGTSAANVINANNLGSGIGLNVTATTGNAISANNSSSVAPTIVATNSGGNNAINATASGAGNGVNINAANGHGIVVSNTGANPAINANNTGNGNALFANNNSSVEPTIFVQNSNSNGVAFQINNNNSANAANFYNFGSGDIIYGNKGAGATGKVAFLTNTNSSNSSPVIEVQNQGSGPAVNIFSGTTSNTALLLNSGHLKSTGLAPTVSVVSNGLGGFAPTASITTQSTDIKGTITVSIPGFTGTSSLGFVDVNVVFNKPYNTGTTVLLTPVEPSRFSYIVTAQNSGNFTVKIINNNSITASFVAGFNFLRFNYFVIE
ncbi:MAG: hypothetical protein SFY56_03970 [Bacteroidota bacterium]|nr:hypothetical protein [Bacteroidota bacterium]